MAVIEGNFFMRPYSYPVNITDGFFQSFQVSRDGVIGRGWIANQSNRKKNPNYVFALKENQRAWTICQMFDLICSLVRVQRVATSRFKLLLLATAKTTSLRWLPKITLKSVMRLSRVVWLKCRTSQNCFQVPKTREREREYKVIVEPRRQRLHTNLSTDKHGRRALNCLKRIGKGPLRRDGVQNRSFVQERPEVGELE